MKRWRVVLATGLLLFGPACGPANEDVEQNGPATVSVLPVSYWDGTSEQELHLAFENSTAMPIQYLFYMDTRPVAFMEVKLFKNGALVASTGPELDGPFLSKKLVRMLKQGERLVHVLKLHEEYSELERGHYDVEVSYDRVRDGTIFATEYGMTPVDFKKTGLRLVVK